MIVIALSVAGLAAMIADRFILKRDSISGFQIDNIRMENDLLRIPFSYAAQYNRLKGASIEYSLCDKRNPRTVIIGGRRTLEHSAAGSNSEYLDIPFSKITQDGSWVVRVKVVHGDSVLNPLYRIFPLSHVLEREFDIELEG